MKKLLVIPSSDFGHFPGPEVWAIDEEIKHCRILLISDKWNNRHAISDWSVIEGIKKYYPENYFIEVNEFPKTLEELKEIAMEVFL
jgi:hypothetical protein